MVKSLVMSASPRSSVTETQSFIPLSVMDTIFLFGWNPSRTILRFRHRSLFLGMVNSSELSGMHTLTVYARLHFFFVPSLKVQTGM